MRKNILAMSIAAMIGGLGLAGGAQAASLPGATVLTAATVLELNGKGVGHQLIVPYYTVQNGQATLINLVNHDTTNGKAVKVRFRGASNSDDVFDFTLFLSPGDMWAAKISQGSDGKARLSTPDASCTLPASVRTNGDAGSPFVTARLDPSASDADKAKGTREGYVEIFNMADIDPGKTYTVGGVAGSNSAIYTATKHVSSVAPCTAAAFSPLSTHANIDTTGEVETLGFRAPTTGLSGTWTIIDIAGSTTYSGNATAVEARLAAGGAASTGRMVLFSQTAASVTTAEADTWTSDPLLRTGGTVAAAQYDFPDLSTPYTGTAAAPVVTDPKGQAYLLTKALAVTSVQNEFYTNSIISGATDWVFSMPTRRYNVALDYNVTSATTPTRLYTTYVGATVNGAATAPAATDFFDATNTSVSGRQICVKGITVGYSNREESSPVVSDDFVVSPGTPGEPLTFCGEASVLSFNDASGDSVLSASVARKDIDVGSYNEGWANLGTPGLGLGLPILGASFQKYVNPAVSAGVLGNYGVAYPHKTK